MGATSHISGLRNTSHSLRAERSFEREAGSVQELLLGTVEPAVGPVRVGSVVHFSAFTGVAVVREERSKRRYKLSRGAVDSALFDRLRKGSMVRFRDNGHNVVAALSIAAPR